MIGISVDSKWCHMAFEQNRNLHFPLLADFEPKGAVSKLYGAYNEKSGQSARAIFVLDERRRDTMELSFSRWHKSRRRWYSRCTGRIIYRKILNMAKLKPPVGGADQSAGNTSASLTLVEFGDYQCPHCRHAHPLIKRLLEDKADSVHFVFRNFPLQEIHPQAHVAALAAEAAGKQGKFWEMHDLIYDNQDQLSAHFLLDLAKELQLDLHRFGNDWKSAEITDKVENDFESGVRSGVNGTPTFFINGNLLMTYDGSYESLVDALELEADMHGR